MHSSSKARDLDKDRQDGKQPQKSFAMDVEAIRQNARKHMDDGAVTAAYQADKSAIIALLQAALATEWICVLRYNQHSVAAAGIMAQSVAEHFKEHADQEFDHAMKLAKRVKQLGGMPNFDPSTLKGRAHSEYKECDSLQEMIQENLVAERIAVDSYTEMLRFVGDSDPTTRHLLVDILKVEEEHAEEMADLLAAFDPREKIN